MQNTTEMNLTNMKTKLQLLDNKMRSKIALESQKISNDQELIQSDPTSCPQNQT